MPLCTVCFYARFHLYIQAKHTLSIESKVNELKALKNEIRALHVSKSYPIELKTHPNNVHLFVYEINLTRVQSRD